MANLAPVDRILARSGPLAPQPTGVAPDLRPLAGIEAVIFDIYGTLVISASGDISLAGPREREHAVREALQAAGIQVAEDAGGLSKCFHAAVVEAQDIRRTEGVACPEVEIREVWESVLAKLQEAGAIGDALFPPDALEALAIEYECRVNPVWPMPGLSELLSLMHASGRALGIVSNAQFYTPLMMEAFLRVPLPEHGFDPELCLYSFVEREAKPSTRLFARLAGRLQARGISPEACLYVGNDQRNDIWPAHELGFRTALFAGDRRSLRLREDDSRCVGIRPTRIITDLMQIPGMLA